MIEEHRTMQHPGQGIVRDAGPAKQHSEYPKHMTHPGFQPGAGDKEIKVIDPDTGRPTGQLIYTGGKSIRFPPVLVMDEDQEEYHKSQGYVTIGKSDPAAFAKAMRDLAPPVEMHVPDEYPKWIAAAGKAANNAEEEAELLGQALSSEESQGLAPTISAEVATLLERPGLSIPADPRLDTLERQVAEIGTNQQALATSIAALNDGMAKLSGLLGRFAENAAPAAPKPQERSAESIARGERIKAGLARKRAAAAAGAAEVAPVADGAAAVE